MVSLRHGLFEAKTTEYAVTCRLGWRNQSRHAREQGVGCKADAAGPIGPIGTASQKVYGNFGIRYSPFTDTLPIAEPFATKGETLLLERIQMLLGQGKSVSVTGEPGSGKSMLIKTLLSGLYDKLAIATTGSGSLLELISLTDDAAQRTASASLVLYGHPVLEKPWYWTSTRPSAPESPRA